MLNAYKRLGCNMSLRINFLKPHIDFFPETLGDCRKEKGERFNEDIKKMK